MELFKSERYTVWAEELQVFVSADGQARRLGTMAGGVSSALITADERYLLVAGCGLWRVHLPLPDGDLSQVFDRAPFVSGFDALVGGGRAYADQPFVYWITDPNKALWPELLLPLLEKPDVVRIFADMDSLLPQVYDLNVVTLEFTTHTRSPYAR